MVKYENQEFSSYMAGVKDILAKRDKEKKSKKIRPKKPRLEKQLTKYGL